MSHIMVTSQGDIRQVLGVLSVLERPLLREPVTMVGDLQATMSADLSSYRDQHFKGSRGEQERLLHATTTLYTGNMSFYTTEEQVCSRYIQCTEVARFKTGMPV